MRKESPYHRPMHDSQRNMEVVGPEAQHSLPFRKPGRQSGWQLVLYRFDLESVSRSYLERNEKAYCRTKWIVFLVEMFCT